MGASERPCRVVLVGMMGSGKTTVGRLLAQKSGWPYLDNDELLVTVSGATAKELLAREGEPKLRKGEAAAMRAGLSKAPPCIIGAPAGAVLHEDLRFEMTKDAFVVWLTADPVTLTQRAQGAGHRPWLEDDPVAWMSTTLAERAPLYKAIADLRVATEGRRPEAVSEEIAAWLEQRCS